MADPRRPDVAPPAVGAESVDPRSTAQVVRAVAENSQALVRKDIELAKLELAEIAGARATAMGAGLGVAMLGLFILAFAGVTGAKALELVLQPWAAWLVVTGVFVLLALIAGLVGWRKATHPPNTPERTKTELEETLEWVKGQVQR